MLHHFSWMNSRLRAYTDYCKNTILQPFAQFFLANPYDLIIVFSVENGDGLATSHDK